MFSDKDLKRMKQEIVDMDVSYDHPFQISTGLLKLIFARLDAAEVALEHFIDSTPVSDEKTLLDEEVEDWRKSRGEKA